MAAGTPHSYIFLTPAHPQPSLGVVKILQQGSSPLLRYVHLVFQVLYKGHTTGVYKSPRATKSRGSEESTQNSPFTPLQQRYFAIPTQSPVSIPFLYLHQGRRHLPLCHSCLHVQLSTTGFQSQPPAEPAGIQTVWAEQEGQKERGCSRAGPADGGHMQHLRLELVTDKPATVLRVPTTLSQSWRTASKGR